MVSILGANSNDDGIVCFQDRVMAAIKITVTKVMKRRMMIVVMSWGIIMVYIHEEDNDKKQQKT